MRRAILSSLLLVLCLAAVPVEPGTNLWTPIGPDGGEILALTADPRQPGVLYAGTHGGLFKSADGGASPGSTNARCRWIPRTRAGSCGDRERRDLHVHAAVGNLSYCHPRGKP